MTPGDAGANAPARSKGGAESPAAVFVAGMLALLLGLTLKAVANTQGLWLKSHESLPGFGTFGNLVRSLQLLEGLFNVIGSAVLFYSVALAVAAAAPRLLGQVKARVRRS
ncbi:MAG: hypothetical protein J0L61_05310 [Planctomycetes bacterium]|nr:hypothetical protein [Planctomycetota bacterium]